MCSFVFRVAFHISGSFCGYRNEDIGVYNKLFLSFICKVLPVDSVSNSLFTALSTTAPNVCTDI